MAYQRVLIATDFSGPALAAARAALSLAPTDAVVRVAHVQPPLLAFDGAPRTDAALVERHAEERRVTLEADLRSWADSAGLPNASVVVRRGNVARELAAEAASFHADVLAVGARGIGRIERFLLGSTSRAVLHRVGDVDLLIGREGAAMDRVLVSTDLNEPSRRAARRGLDVATRNQAQLLVMHVLEPGPFGDVMRDSSAPLARHHDELREWAKGQLNEINQKLLAGRAIEVLVEGRPAHEVVRFAEEHAIRLVVVGSHGAGALERVLLGSVAEAVAERAPCSVLVVRA